MEINSLSQRYMTMAAYYTKLKSFCNELENYRKTYTCAPKNWPVTKGLADEPEEKCLYQFLLDLSDIYNNVRSSILNDDPLPMFKKAYAIMAREEQPMILQKIEMVETTTICGKR
ncbi:UNVERIFIED_CONTAM: hypothetical protein Slati_2513900 [Sesamum latifolium]|uniref:Uncharacterized protein n=1 Tax=Sesamum latifolium TaxID=2727402 RepID=A0AAW2WGU3_9LAMI